MQCAYIKVTFPLCVLTTHKQIRGRFKIWDRNLEGMLIVKYT